MKEIKVNSSTELVNKIKELMGADKELKLCGWYQQSKTTSFDFVSNKKGETIRKAHVGVRLGKNWKETINVYIESEDDCNEELFDEISRKVIDEIRVEPSSDFQIPKSTPQFPQPSQERTLPQPKSENKQPNYEDDDNILDSINKYFQENKVSSVELNKDKKCWIIYEDERIRCIPSIEISELKKVKGYLEKNNKNSISKKELASLNKNRQTNTNPSILYYLV